MQTRFQLNSSLPRPAPGTKVLRAADLEVLHDAAELIEAARAEAEEIRRKAEEVYRERYEAGYADGVEAGKMEHAEKMM